MILVPIWIYDAQIKLGRSRCSSGKELTEQDDFPISALLPDYLTINTLGRMKLLVTGSNGSVGQRVVRLALIRGHIVTGVDITPLPEELKELIGHKQDAFTFKQIDLTDYDRALEVLRTSECEAVIHLAALHNPTDYGVQTHNKFDFQIFDVYSQLKTVIQQCCLVLEHTTGMCRGVVVISSVTQWVIH